MRATLLILCLAACTKASASSMPPAPQPVPGTVAAQDRASMLVTGPKKPPAPTGPGWRGAFDVPTHGDMVLTRSEGQQERWPGAGRHPCALGCADLYQSALSAASHADAGPEPDVTLDQAIDGISRCVRACEAAGAITWPPPGGTP